VIMFQLKQYQERSLEQLREYLRLARETDAKHAFVYLTEEPYRSVEPVSELPYVCLRVPTGGGKTVMACYAVGLATRELLQSDRSVVLWLVPTNQIREQTLSALRDPLHPYRQGLQESLNGEPVTVMDLSEALWVQRPTLDAGTCVVVSTLAALRVGDTEGRKVYESAGALMSHFQGISDEQLAGLERDDSGSVAYSLANVLRLRRPVVIMDEAHNARTPLSFDTLARFAPACVIEFTATPERQHDPARDRFASNVLWHVSAWELKAESMIKMPIHLETRTDWREVVREALARRDQLEKLARDEEVATGEYLRPIVLLQAQPRSRTMDTLSVDRVETALQEDYGIAPEQIRVATADRREIQGEDILSRDSPARVIITVAALREGWDCPFAYVLCSVSEVGTPRAVEQVLGRIMRLPRATAKQHPELNAAYAYVASRRFAETAGRLRDGLVAHGFDKLEAARMVADAQGKLFTPGTLFADPSGRPSPADKGVPLRVPALGRRIGGRLELWESEDFLPGDWNLAHRDASLSDAQFSLATPRSGSGTIDAGENGLTVRFVERAVQEVALLHHEEAWTADALVNWLDRNIPHPDVPQAHSLVFIRKTVEHLTDVRGLDLTALTRDRFRLRDALQRKMADHRQDAKQETLQAVLVRPEEVVVSPEVCFSYGPNTYPANWYYEGSYDFQNHYYPVVGELHAAGEEFECAKRIDTLLQIKHWVRNLERRSRHSFWLPTTSDLFYPDFVAELHDGRHLVVEYKGEHLRETPDTKEKESLGNLWAERSNGRCVFFLATKDNLDSLEALVS